MRAARPPRIPRAPFSRMISRRHARIWWPAMGIALRRRGKKRFTTPPPRLPSPPRTASWCNGSTADSESACLGSNPSEATISAQAELLWNVDGYRVPRPFERFSMRTQKSAISAIFTHQNGTQPALSQDSSESTVAAGHSTLGSRSKRLPTHIAPADTTNSLASRLLHRLDNGAIIVTTIPNGRSQT